jgi:hypothetical protein
MSEVYREFAKIHIWLGAELVDEAQKPFACLKSLAISNERAPFDADITTKGDSRALPWICRLRSLSTVIFPLVWKTLDLASGAWARH